MGIFTLRRESKEIHYEKKNDYYNGLVQQSPHFF